ncbi:MAG TPA: class I SAM-dependent methyltransferase [Tepidisphaeraceae bacterium]|nr:class I SAM-dependent methyltransferase [Tepidisphaeraceae bacterium]
MPSRPVPDATTRFTDRVNDYVKYRPTYPLEVIDFLRVHAALSPAHVVADVGSGTGISAELLLRNGNVVFGVEPNADMRAAAERSLRAYTNFYSVGGRAEATTLADGSVDLVVAAQAFHWFDLGPTATEFRRILRPGGHVVLLWNDRKTGGTPFLEGYERLLLAHAIDYRQVNHSNVTSADVDAFTGGPVVRGTFANAQHMDLDGLLGRARSSSYLPRPGQPGHDALMAGLRTLFKETQQGGRVTIEYVTEVYVARTD